KARMKAIFRRSGSSDNATQTSKLIELKNLTLDCDSRRLFIDGKEIRLTAKEYDLLELLAKHMNKVYSRESLMNIVWGYDFVGDVRTVDVHIRRLREKIEKDPSAPEYVHTKWGAGYYFNDHE
ncbi:MAG: response regulator transcription factor, partial [Lachnospiraceae bacterium]|nr:response regulator transcription factor [Lachnospiraceae bacterium]